MLKAKISNTPLIADNDFSCRLQIKNPACMFDELPGALAADLSFPKKGNQATLRNPDRFTKQGAQNDRQFDDFRLIHHGINLLTGTLIIDDPSESYSGWAQSLLGKLADDLKEKLINQIDLGEFAFTNKTTFDPLADQWCTIRLKNKGFFEGIGKMTTYRGEVTDVYGNTTQEDIETELLTKKFLDTSNYFVNAPGTGGVITSADENEVAVVSPFPFIHLLIDKLLRANQFYIADNFLKTDPDLQNLCLYHSWNILKANPVTVTRSLRRLNFFSGHTESRNYEELTKATWEPDNFSLNELLPDATIGDVMLGIQNTTNSFFWFDNNHKVRLIHRDSILQGEAFDLTPYQVSDWIPGERKNVRLKFSWEHDSDDSAFQDAWEDLSDVRDRIKPPVATRDALENYLLARKVGDIRLVKGEGVFYEYKWFEVSSGGSKSTEESTDVLGWKETSINLQDYYFNDGDREEEEIKSIFSTLRMDPEGFPIAFQKGNSHTFNQVGEAFSPRLLFFKGNNTGGDESPAGAKFSWDGDLGLLRKYWRLWAPFWANRLPVTADFRLPSSILSYVINNIYQKFRTREGEFIIEVLDCEPGNDKEVICTIQGFKVEDNFWQFNPGTVAGGGDGTNVDYNPKFVGTNESGKPYAVETNGKYYSTSIFGTISQAPYAPTTAVAYNPGNRQLYVGGTNGQLHIYDCTSPTFPMKTIIVYSHTDDISCVQYIPVNGKILIGRQNNSSVYSLDAEPGINDYTDNSALEGSSNCSGYFRDFISRPLAVGVKYYGITSEGEFAISTNLASWTEQWDISGHFTRFAQGGGYYYIMEDNDRPFYTEDPDGDWHEFDLNGDYEPPVVEAISNGTRVVAIGVAFNREIFFIDAPDTITIKQFAAYPKGAVYDAAGDLFMCGEDAYTHSGRLYMYNGVSFNQQFLLPDPLTKLFNF